MKSLSPIVVLVVCLLGVVSCTADEVLDDRWYVVMNGDERIGYMHMAVTQAPDEGPITSTQDVKLVMARAGTTIEIAIGSSFVETPEGQPLSGSSTMNMGGLPIETRAAFLEQGVRVSSGQAGRMTTTMKPPIEGDWLPPRALSRYIEEQLAAGAAQIKSRTVDLSSGLTPIETTMVRVGPEAVEVYGKTVPATAWDLTVSSMPTLKLRDYLDDEGTSIKSTIALMPGLEMTVLEADKALALSKLTPTEIMAQTFVVPSRPIERPRELRRGMYVLRTRQGGVAPSLPDLERQYIYQSDAKQTGVMILTEQGQFPVGMPHRDIDKPDPDRYLTASPVLNHEDPKIQEAFTGAVLAMSEADPSPMQIGLRLRTFVNLTVQTKDLSVGFATASDVARTKQGDCTEHAVYLAALLRAGGIPSRCVSGLVYADQFAGHEGIFGYHMWTQAWIDDDGEGPQPGRWVDLDATLPDGVPFDATHIALSVSDMNDGVISDEMAALLPVLGNLEIEVVETVYSDSDAAP